jgi:hypothetical protein
VYQQKIGVSRDVGSNHLLSTDSGRRLPQHSEDLVVEVEGHGLLVAW